MIQSMTAFARTQDEGEWGSLVCELRSINHRYLELSLRLPETLQKCEISVREKVREKIKRGKVECFLRFKPTDNSHEGMVVNISLVKQLCDTTETVAQYLINPASVSPVEILKWPGVLQASEMNIELVQQRLLVLIEKALQELVNARQREGKQLKSFILQRLDLMGEELQKVKLRLPSILIAQKEKLQTRFLEAKLECNLLF